MLGPTFAQVNAEISIVEVAIAQLSVAEAVTSAGMIEAFPEASNCTVIS